MKTMAIVLPTVIHAGATLALVMDFAILKLDKFHGMVVIVPSLAKEMELAKEENACWIRIVESPVALPAQ